MRLTVLTPTYDRAYVLHELYKSLKAQTVKDFEWIIVDDGSNDNTEELVAPWLDADNGFDILYVKKENGGKHTAVNEGVLRARGELTFIVDSDDRLTPDAVETVLSYADGLPKEGKWAGVAGLRGYTSGKAIGSSFEGDYLDATALEREKYNIDGDKAEVVFTQVLKEFPFKVFEGERFLTEATVWLKIAAAGYKFRWFNNVIYEGEYREDGLTKNLAAVQSKNPQGALYTAKVYIETAPNLKTKLHACNAYRAVAAANGVSAHAARKNLGVSPLIFGLARLARMLKHGGRA